jgi:hypothetical protein
VSVLDKTLWYHIEVVGGAHEGVLEYMIFLEFLVLMVGILWNFVIGCWVELFVKYVDTIKYVRSM